MVAGRATRSQQRFGKRRALRAFRDFRSAEDPEAPTTVLGKRFPYQRRRSGPRGGRAVPTAARCAARRRRREARAAPRGELGRLGLLARRAAVRRQSNALLVSGARVGQRPPADGRRPAGRLLQPADPDGAGRARARAHGRPGDRRARRGVRRRQPLRPARPRARLRVERDLGGPGHHRHLRADLCEPGGGRPRSSMHYRYRGRCLPIEVLEKTELAGSRRPATTRRPARRRCAPSARSSGSSPARGTVRGKPVIFTKLRSTYFHEVDSRRRASWTSTTPTKIRDAASFQRAASKIGYTFNWFYADAEHIAYFNSGANPVRAKRVDHDFPVRARRSTEWRGWDPDRRHGALHAVRAAPAGDRPGVPRRLEQQAGARLRAAPDENVVLLRVPLAAARGPR